MRRIILLLGLALGGIALAVFLSTTLITEASPVIQERVEETRLVDEAQDEAPTSLIRESLSVGDSILIEVKDRTTQQPLGDADVFVIDLEEFGFGLEQFLGNGEMGHDLFFFAYATGYRADSKGRLHIPVPKGKLFIRGMTGSHFGEKTWESLRADSLLLELDHASMVPVQVMAANGKPAEGVSVGLYFFRDKEYIGMTGMISKSDGVAIIRVPSGFLDDSAGIVAQVTPFVLSVDAPHAEIDLNQIPEDPVVLRLPETGSVEVTLLEENGNVAQGAWFGILVLMWPTEDGEGWTNSGSSLPLQFRNGRATLGHVGLGLQLQASVWNMQNAKSGKLEGSGPRTMGANVKMELAIAEPKQTDHYLLGRVLNTKGMVAKNLELELRIRDSQRPSRHGESHKVRTGADGRFRYKIQMSDYLAEQLDVSLIMRRTKRKPRRMATIGISQPFTTEEMELGDFVVRELPAMVSGKVLDASGESVEKASVVVSHRVRSDLRWEELSELNVYSQDDGSFVIRGEKSKGEFQLVASKSGFVDTQEIASFGEGSVVLKLDSGIQLTGRLFFDEEYIRDEVLVKIRSGNGSSNLTMMRKGEDSFTFENVVPGLVELDFMTIRGVTFYRWSGIQVGSNSETFSLPDLNLRGRLTSIQVILQDEHGQVIRDGWIKNDRTGAIQGFRGKPIEILGLDNQYHLVVGARGKRRLDLGEVSKDQVITLANALPIRLVLDGTPHVGSGWRLSSRLSRANAVDRVDEIMSWTNQEGYMASVPWLGQVRVELYLSHDDHMRGSQVGEVIIVNSRFNIEILDLKEEQVFHFSISQDSIDQTKALILEREQAMDSAWD